MSQFPMPNVWWPPISSHMTASKRPWPEEAAMLDLRWYSAPRMPGAVTWVDEAWWPAIASFLHTIGPWPEAACRLHIWYLAGTEHDEPCVEALAHLWRLSETTAAHLFEEERQRLMGDRE